MKRLYLIVAVVGTVSLALPPVTNAGWMRTYGKASADYGRWVEQTSDGGYVIAGSLEIPFSEPRAEAIYLIKTDSVGDTLWTRMYPADTSSRLGTWGQCVQQTADGGYIVAGSKDTGPGDATLIKTDPQGNVEWSRLYEDADIAYCVRQMPDRGYVVTGSTDSLYPGREHRTAELWLMRTDAEGTPLWSGTYGDDNDDMGYSLQLASDGGCIIIGAKGLPLEEGGRGARLWLLKTDEQGDTLWTRTYAFDETDTIPAEVGYCVEQTSDGGYVITGVVDYNPFGLGGALWLLKTDENGDTLWTKVYDYDIYGEIGKSVKQTLDGGYIITGAKNYNMAGMHDLWLLRTDSGGDTLWTRTYGEEGTQFADEGRCVQLTADNGYIITGFTESLSTHGGPDVWLIKTDSLGYVGVEEEAPVAHLSTWQISAPIGPQITLHYSDHPEGFHASVFDVTGRKVDEIHTTTDSGTITWPVKPGSHQSGVYFIRETRGSKAKVVLIR